MWWRGLYFSRFALLSINANKDGSSISSEVGTHVYQQFQYIAHTSLNSFKTWSHGLCVQVLLLLNGPSTGRVHFHSGSLTWPIQGCQHYNTLILMTVHRDLKQYPSYFSFHSIILRQLNPCKNSHPSQWMRSLNGTRIGLDMVEKKTYYPRESVIDSEPNCRSCHGHCFAQCLKQNYSTKTSVLLKYNQLFRHQQHVGCLKLLQADPLCETIDTVTLTRPWRLC